MGQGAQTSTAPPWNWRSRHAQFTVGSVVICLLIAAVYYRVLVKLVTDWWQIPDFSHGFLVPLFAAYLVWEKRETLRATKIAPSWGGIVVMVLGLVVLLLASTDLISFSREFRWSFCWPEWFSALATPVLEGAALRLAGPVAGHSASGHYLQPDHLSAADPGFKAGQRPSSFIRRAGSAGGQRHRASLDEAGSGGGLQRHPFPDEPVHAVGFLRILPGEVRLAANSARLASIPIAIAANAVRILGTGLCVQYWDPDKAMGFFHEFSGWVIFLVSLAFLYLVHRAMSLFPGKGGRHEESSFWTAVLLLAGTALLLHTRSSTDRNPFSEPLAQLPGNIEGWVGSDQQIDQETLDILGAGYFLFAHLFPAYAQTAPIGLFIGYFPTQRTGQTIHSPKHCLPGPDGFSSRQTTSIWSM